MPEELPHIVNASDITRGELVHEILRGARLVVYPYAVSFVVTSYEDGSAWLLRRSDPEPSTRRQILVSLLFGWWGLSGIRATMRAVRTCRTGGADVTDRFFAAYASREIRRLGRPTSSSEPVNEAALDEAVPHDELPASAPSRRPIRPVALALLTALVVPTLVVLAIVSGSPGRRIDELDVGDCFDLPAGDTVTTVDLRPCDERHDAELVAIVRLDDDALAAAEVARFARARVRCRELAVEAGVDAELLDRDVSVGVFLQRQGSDEVRRTARCYLASDTGLVGSLADT